MNTEHVPKTQRDIVIAFLVFLACILYSFFVQHESIIELPAVLVGN